MSDILLPPFKFEGVPSDVTWESDMELFFNSIQAALQAYTDTAAAAQQAYTDAAIAAINFDHNYLTAQPSGDHTIIYNTWTDIPNLTFTTDKAGIWLITLTAGIAGEAASGNCVCRLVVDGSVQTGLANVHVVTAGHDVYATVGQHWVVSIASGKVCKIQDFKDVNGGTAFVYATDTRLTGVWIHS